MNIKFGLILDKPNQFLNKGSNTLFLGDFEYCNAGDRSARIYAGDSNGDIIEIEDDVQGKLEELRQKILIVTENLPTENWKPKLIYLVKSDGSKQTYSKDVIKNMYNYYQNNIERIKPYHVHVNNLGIEHKILPYLDDRTVFGIIDGINIEDMVSIMLNLGNKLLENHNHIFTIIYNTIRKYNLNISEAYNEIARCMYDFDNILKNSLKVYLYLEKIMNDTNTVIGELGCSDKIYTTTKFVNGTADRYSTLNFSSKNSNKDHIDEPFVDMLVVAMSGTSIVKYCSFRVDKRTASISNFYGDSTFFYFENSASYPKLPLCVKNRYTYKIITNWDLNMVDTLTSKIIPTAYSNLYVGITNDVQLEDLIVLSNTGVPCKLELTVDEKGGRILNTIDRTSNKVLSSIRSEKTSAPSGNYIRLIDGNITAFFPLDTTKKVSGVQPLIYQKSQNRNLYLQHTEKYPLYNQLRFTAWHRTEYGGYFREHHGTRRVSIFDFNDKETVRITADPVFPTVCTNYVVNIPTTVKEIKKLGFDRFIDAKSSLRLGLKVDIYSEKTGWKHILEVFSYRARPWWVYDEYTVNLKME